MRLPRRLIIAASLSVLAGGPALAHHAFALFDREHEQQLVGTVKSFQWADPHTWLVLDVPEKRGASRIWTLEGRSTGMMSRQGWASDSFKPGDKVTVKILPMRDGSAGGAFIGAILADGRELGRIDPRNL